MDNKKVDILIITYNAEKYIKKTLQSCLDQTYQEYEILILDNNSSDDTCVIIESFNDEKIKLFKGKKNIGPYNGLNYLLERARGNYIAIQDHDDIWLLQKIEKQVQFLDKNNEFIACGTNTYYFFEEDNELVLDKKSFKTDFVDHTSLMFRNNGFRYDNKYMSPDEYFEKKILTKKGKIACLQDVLTIHRIRQDNKNLSVLRCECTINHIKQFFNLNNINLTNLAFVAGMCFGKYIPNSIKTFVRKNILQKNKILLSYDDFVKKHGNIL
jgi:glycosyltransferase involved in cell wall biosynthesis